VYLMKLNVVCAIVVEGSRNIAGKYN